MSLMIGLKTKGQDFLVGDISIPLIEGAQLQENTHTQLEGFGDDLDHSPSQWDKLEVLWRNGLSQAPRMGKSIISQCPPIILNLNKSVTNVHS
jgi:hypothetical protein